MIDRFTIRPWVHLIYMVVLLSLLTGCSPSQLTPVKYFTGRHDLGHPVDSDFSICYRHGCTAKVRTRFDASDWKRIMAVFQPRAENPAKEREQIGLAIPIMETIIGEKTGIDSDLGGSFAGMTEENQMDCVDEALNTHTFLKLLEQKQLTRFHTIAGIANRGFFFNGWPHVACAVKDSTTNQIFVVDSWFLDQGKPIHILPFDTWKSGWRPDK